MTKQELEDLSAELIEFLTALRDHIANKLSELDDDDDDDETDDADALEDDDA